MLENMQFLTLRAVFTAQQDGVLPPYLGSTLRGILGHCIHDFACTNPGKQCYACEKKRDCIYTACFASAGTPAGAVNPFVLYARKEGKTRWKKGEPLAFDLTLIGRTVERAGLFLEALYAMSRRGWGVYRLTFALEQIADPISNRLIYAGGKTWMQNLCIRTLESKPHPASAALIRFDTPVSIVSSGVLCKDPDFQTLVRFLSRRISLLALAYTDHTVEWTDSFYEAAKHIKTVQSSWRERDIHRYSMNQKEGHLSLPGIEGWILYEGNLEPFTPLLYAGQILHMGKNATHGYGHFEVLYG